MINLGTLQAGVNIASGIAGLFRKKPKQPTPRDNLLSQAQGAREAAEKYGFNPLTMLQYGQVGGSLGGAIGDHAPLASAQILSEGLRGLDDELTGRNARQRQQEELQLDLAQLQLEQLRSGVVTANVNAADQVGGGLSPLGHSAGVHHTGAGRARPVNRGSNNARVSAIDPTRPVDVEPEKNVSGVFQIENRMTGGPISIPGDGEPWGWDEAATAVGFGVPQVIDNHVTNAGHAMRRSWGLEPQAQWPKDVASALNSVGDNATVIADLDNQQMITVPDPLHDPDSDFYAPFRRRNRWRIGTQD